MGKRDNLDESLGRARRVRLLHIAAFFFIVLLGKLFSLQAIEHDVYVEDAKKNQFLKLRIPASRGLIVDRNGVVMVDNVPRFDVVLPWRKKSNAMETIASLCKFLSLDSTSVFLRFEAWAKKNAGVPFPLVVDADKLMISVVRENVDLFPQLRVETRARRRYRKVPCAAHLLGYVAEVSDEELAQGETNKYQPGDMIGKTGLELVCEKYLRGEDGFKIVQVNAWGTILGDVSTPAFVPVAGSTVKLTIDAEIQAYVEERLTQEGIGAAVFMDVSDGSILAAASIPQYDPNSFAMGINKEEWDRLYDEESKPLFNRYLQATYPPGSTLKIISACVVLENEVVDPNMLLEYCTGAHQFGNRIYRCWKEEGHGWMDLHNAVVQSCDSYFFEVGEELDVDEITDFARRFGLGDRTGIELRGEAKGLVPDRNYYNKRFGKGKWTQGNVLNNIIGQGEFLTSLLQMCRIAAAVANGGFLVSPHVIESTDGEPYAIHQNRRVRNVSVKNLRFLQRSMRGVVEDPDGTAYWTRISGFPAAGKTGTAQNPHGEDHAWFIGYAPADEPEIAVAVVIENAGHGGDVAAPLVRDVYRKYFEKKIVGDLLSSQNHSRIITDSGGRSR